MKQLVTVVLMLCLLGAAAYAYERYVVSPKIQAAVDRADRADSIAALKSEEAALALADNQRLLQIDSLRADSMRRDSIWMSVLQGRLAQKESQLSRARTPRDTILVLVNTLATAEQGFETCLGTLQTCYARIQMLRDSIIRRDTTQIVALILANDSLRAANRGLRDVVKPALTFPRLMLNVGRYVEHGVAIMGAVCIASEWIGGSDSRSANLSLYQPFNSRQALIRVEVPW